MLWQKTAKIPAKYQQVESNTWTSNHKAVRDEPNTYSSKSESQGVTDSVATITMTIVTSHSKSNELPCFLLLLMQVIPVYPQTSILRPLEGTRDLRCAPDMCGISVPCTRASDNQDSY